MNTVTKIWLFIVIEEGVEKIAMYPDRQGKPVPLVYFSEQSIRDDNMRQAIQVLATKHKLHFELREYWLVDEHREVFDPPIQQYNA